jgi:anti-anti-sigma factor
MLSRQRDLQSRPEVADSFTVLVYCDNARASVVPRGELDMASAGELDRTLSHLRRQGYKFVQVDFGGITFVDATGLEVLLRAHESFAARHGRLIVRNLSRQAQRLVRVTGAGESLLLDSA